MGIRNGITELSNFHLSEAPAYGSSDPAGRAPDRRRERARSRPASTRPRTSASTTAGTTTDDPYYAVRQSNLKALQLRMNWIYVVPGPSYLRRVPRALGLGAALAGADRRDERRRLGRPARRDRRVLERRQRRPERARRPVADWVDRPYVRNLERWLVQVDEPGSVAHRTDVRRARRGLREPTTAPPTRVCSTDVAAGDTGFAFDVDERVRGCRGRLAPRAEGDVPGCRAPARSRSTPPRGRRPPVARTGDGVERTATIALPDGALEGGHRIRISLAPGPTTSSCDSCGWCASQSDGAPRHALAPPCPDTAGWAHAAVWTAPALIRCWCRVTRIPSLTPGLGAPVTPQKILFDVDTGIDDSLALLYLLASPDEAEILAITCTVGQRARAPGRRSTTSTGSRCATRPTSRSPSGRRCRCSRR